MRRARSKQPAGAEPARAPRGHKLSAAEREALSLQLAILKATKERIRDHIGANPPELEAYSRTYEGVFRRTPVISSKRELVREAREADLVFCGDYHSLRQAQKTHVKILREVVKTRRVALAIEMVEARDQPRLDAFMRGTLDEREFLEAIDYEATWGFPWENYRIVFDFARAHGIPVVGLNFKPPRRRPGRLLKRDAFAAQILARLMAEDPERLVWCMYGDLHLAPQHMPAEVERILERRGDRRRVMLVYQNNKALWNRLARRGLVPGVDTVKLGPGRWCVLNTPPWIKLQSYLDHLERSPVASRRDHGDDDEAEGSAYDDQVAHVVGELARVLGIRSVPTDHFQVLGPDELEALPAPLPWLAPSRLPVVLPASGCVYFPETRTLYLDKIDANHAAEGAAEYLHHMASGYRLEGRDDRDAFYLRTLQKAVGFFGSLLLNPKRKTDYFLDHELTIIALRGRRRTPLQEGRLRVARRVVEHQRAFDRLISQGKPLRLRAVYREDRDLGQGVSRALGYIMGDKLHRGLMQGVVTKEDLLAFLSDPLPPGRSLEVYSEFRRRLKAVRKHFHSKEEFF